LKAKIIQLSPPKIDLNTIDQRIVASRPMREESFNISLQPFSGNPSSKLIINCYGHGGSGFTTLFGSVRKAIKLFVTAGSDKKLPIRIIGAGCVGLTTAIELHRLGYNVCGISAKSLYDIPSWKTAGYFAFVSLKTSPLEQQNLNEIGVETFLVYKTIEKGTHPYIPPDAVRYLPVYCSQETPSGVEDLEARGLIPPREDVTLNFIGGAIHANYKQFMTYFLNTTTLMKSLSAEVRKRNIPIKIETVSSFDELEEGCIFCCAGLGARELQNDRKLIPVRGHLITLKGQLGSEHMKYMIYSKVKYDHSDEYLYLFPKDRCVSSEHPEGTSCSGVLGGTFIPNIDDLPKADLERLDKREFDKLLARAKLFFYETA